MRVYIQPGCGEPEALVRTLLKRAPFVRDVEVVHLLTLGCAVPLHDSPRAIPFVALPDTQTLNSFENSSGRDANHFVNFLFSNSRTLILYRLSSQTLHLL